MAALSGRVAIVTGASRGLGKDIAVSLARAGAVVAAVARTELAGQSRIPGTLEATVELIRGEGGAALAIRGDVTSESSVAEAVQRTLAEFGRVDMLVNNAGILIPGSTAEMSPRHWELALRVNLTGPFLCCRAVIPHMKGSGGHIINISSRGAIGPGAGPYQRAQAGGTAYGSTKAALERFTQGLAAELCEDRIAVNALSPHRVLWSEGGHYFRSQSGEPAYSGWRLSGEIIGDACAVICAQDPAQFTGNILYDELVMLATGGLSREQVAQRYPVEP